MRSQTRATLAIVPAERGDSGVGYRPCSVCGRDITGIERRYVTVAEAAVMYGVSTDWIYRNPKIKKAKDGPRFVRVNLKSLDDYFREREN